MASETQSFLDAEESVNQLLKNLKKIKAEIEGYKNAKESLEAAASQVVQLASALNGTAELTTDVVKKLGEIGTPEIMDAVNRLSEINDGVRNEIGKVADAIDGMGRGIDGMGGEIGGIERLLGDMSLKFEQVAKSVESLKTLEQKIAGSLKKQEDTIKKEIAKGNQDSQSVITEMNKKVSSLSGDLGTSRMISIATAVMIGILLIVMLFKSGSL